MGKNGQREDRTGERRNRKMGGHKSRGKNNGGSAGKLAYRDNSSSGVAESVQNWILP